MLFYQVHRYPELLSGEITLDHRLILKISCNEFLHVLLPITVVAALSGDPYVIGGVLGVLALMAVHTFWGWQAQRKKDKAAAKQGPVSEETDE
jgi:hypothetical protein